MSNGDGKNNIWSLGDLQQTVNFNSFEDAVAILSTIDHHKEEYQVKILEGVRDFILGSEHREMVCLQFLESQCYAEAKSGKLLLFYLLGQLPDGFFTRSNRLGVTIVMLCAGSDFRVEVMELLLSVEAIFDTINTKAVLGQVETFFAQHYLNFPLNQGKDKNTQFTDKERPIELLPLLRKRRHAGDDEPYQPMGPGVGCDNPQEQRFGSKTRQSLHEPTTNERILARVMITGKPKPAPPRAPLSASASAPVISAAGDSVRAVDPLHLNGTFHRSKSDLALGGQAVPNHQPVPNPPNTSPTGSKDYFTMLSQEHDYKLDSDGEPVVMTPDLGDMHHPPGFVLHTNALLISIR